MHCCFHITEILTLICNACRDPRDDDDASWVKGENIQSLARLARTCKGVHAVAIACLWEDVTALEILAEYTMPGCWRAIVMNEDDDDDAWMLLPEHLITESDLVRFRYYAPFIRKMSFGEGAWPKMLSEDGFLALCMTDTYPLLPNLTHISWNIGDIHLLYLRYLATPALVSLYITGGMLSMGEVHILQFIQQRCENVTKVRLQFDHSGPLGQPVTVRSLGEVICSWRLRSLATSHIDAKALRKLAASPTLRTFHVTAESGVQDCITMAVLTGPNLPLSFPLQAFSVLTNMTIRSWVKDTSLARMLRLCSFGCLDTLKIHSLLPPVGWQNLLTAVRESHASRKALRRLVLKERVRLGADSDDPSPGSVIAPLRDFGALEELTLSSNSGFSLDSDELLNMAKAWPQIRVLQIFPASYSPDETLRLPMHALQHLAAHCPRLSTLHLEVDATEVSLSQAPPDVRNYALRTLNVGWSPISSAVGVSAYLSSVFPNIDSIECGPLSDPPPLDALHHNSGVWSNTAALMKAFRAVRAHEARCLSGSLSGQMAHLGVVDSLGL
ncbi:hypothetical protein BD626DRAFT_544904 [Schizophyllum amplum]|uniref:F-box domain-containing protein n=1 Tax=Schizophyllum amplum TaxID=97359 RepID=A0A550CRG8_9AGAR|nr:hypothetical protein BD626DRAFT_544904 [Auriculariopsis ampla]